MDQERQWKIGETVTGPGRCVPDVTGRIIQIAPNGPEGNSPFPMYLVQDGDYPWGTWFFGDELVEA